MKAVILAGGRGTRLGLTNIPKPMVSIDGKPLLEHQINLLRKYGINELIILTGYLSNKIEEYFKDGTAWNIHIAYLKEDKPLGTAGAIKQLEGQIKERFIVFYGDIMMDFDLSSFIDFDKKTPSLVTLITHPNDHPQDSDLVEIEEGSNNVLRFLSKPHQDGMIYHNCVNSAIYILSPDIFKFITPNEHLDFGKDIFPKVLTDHQNVIKAYNTSEFIKDIGTPERLAAVEKEFMNGRITGKNKGNKQPAIFIDRDGVVNEEVNNLSHIQQFKLLKNVEKSIAKLNASEYLAIIITNQPAVAKGFLTEVQLQEIHKKLETELGKEGAFVDKIYYCPHHPESGFEGEVRALKIECACRKPKIGMIEKAVKEFNIDLQKSYMIGDSTTDIMTGINAGLKTVLVETGYGGRDKKYNCKPDYIALDLPDAINIILNEDKNGN